VDQRGARPVRELSERPGVVALGLEPAADAGVRGHVLVHDVDGHQRDCRGGVAGRESGLELGGGPDDGGIRVLLSICMTSPRRMTT
jgi:hypothetical protein